MSDLSLLWNKYKADLLPALKVDKHVAKPIGGGKKVHFHLKDGVVHSDDGPIEKIEE